MQGGKAQANIGGKKRGTAQGKLEQEGQKGLEGACGVGGGAGRTESVRCMPQRGQRRGHHHLRHEEHPGGTDLAR